MFRWSDNFKPIIKPTIIQKVREPNIPEWNKCIKNLADSVRDKEVIPSKANKAAVIVEPRDTPVLYDLLVWMKYILLPHGWEIIVYSGLNNTQKLKEMEGITVKNMNKHNMSVSEYNNMCLTKKFWEDIPFENILIFQIDSVLLDGDLTAFLKYDYVGSPWKKDCIRLQDKFSNMTFFSKNSSGAVPKPQKNDMTGNGGLSLRRKSGMIRSLKPLPWKHVYEDQFFSVTRAGMLNIPPPEISTHFSTESIYNPTTLGYHKPWLYLSKDEMNSIYERMRLLSKSLSS